MHRAKEDERENCVRLNKEKMAKVEANCSLLIKYFSNLVSTRDQCSMQNVTHNQNGKVLFFPSVSLHLLI